jgi:hypothetical protein
MGDPDSRQKFHLLTDFAFTANYFCHMRQLLQLLGLQLLLLGSGAPTSLSSLSLRQ